MRMRCGLAVVFTAFFIYGCTDRSPKSQEPASSPTASANDHQAPRAKAEQIAYPHVSKITPADTDVPTSLPYKQQVEKHAEVLEKLTAVLRESEEAKVSAKKTNSLNDYLAAEGDEQNTFHYLAPYSVGQAKAQDLKNENYKMTTLNDTQGSVCNAQGQCSNIDPITALFMIISGLFTKEFNDGKPPFGPNNDIIKFLQQPLGGPNNDLVKIREFLLGHDENGEIARLIRDPVMRPVQIVQDARDKIIPPSDNGDIARAIRDPVNCTVGKLWGDCK